MLEASINLKGATTDDLADTLRIVLRMIEKEITKGIDRCDLGGYNFNVEEKSEQKKATASAAK